MLEHFHAGDHIELAGMLLLWSGLQRLEDVEGGWFEAGFLAVAPAVFDRLGDDITVLGMDHRCGAQFGEALE